MDTTRTVRLQVSAVLLLAALLGLSSAWLGLGGLIGPVLLAVALGLLAALLVLTAFALVARWSLKSAMAVVTQLTERETSATFLTNADGDILSCNKVAAARFGDPAGMSLAGSLRMLLASPIAVISRLAPKVQQDGSASEDIVTRTGSARVSAVKLNGSNLLWRVEDLPDPGLASQSLPIPMLSTGPGGDVLMMNAAAHKLVGYRPQVLDDLVVDPPLKSDAANVIKTESGRRSVWVVRDQRSGDRDRLYLIPLSESELDHKVDGFDTLPVPMIKLTTEGRIIAANTLAEGLLAMEIGPDTRMHDVMQGLGRPIDDLLSDTIGAEAKPQSEFLRLSRRDREVFVQITLSRAMEDGQTVLIAVLNDATELKTLEAQFVQSQKMQAIGQLAGGVAHDFNNLLTAITGHCDLLLLRHDQGDPDYGDLVQINQNANRAAALVSQLLAFSRKQTLRPQVLDLRDTLSDLTHLLNRLVGEKVSLSLSHDPVLKPVRADKRQIEQVLMDLVVNARDAMPDGGRIAIETGVEKLDSALERNRATVPPGEYVTVRVTDQGCGIAPDKVQKVFEPFYTTKRTGEGTGLGLSTAYGIVKQTGGFIFVDSTEGEGTTFILYLPVHEDEPVLSESAPEPVPAKSPAQTDGVVLLVEDEAPVRAFASRALRLRGYTVLEADSAEAALEMLEDQALRVDVFVTDVVMPGMDGPSWVRKALKDRPDVSVVFVSGYAEGAFGEADYEVEKSVFLPKPFSLKQLTETVQRQLN